MPPILRRSCRTWSGRRATSPSICPASANGSAIPRRSSWMSTSAWPRRRERTRCSRPNTCHIMSWPQVERLFAGDRPAAARSVRALRAVQLPRPAHLGEQRALRCHAARARSGERHPRFRKDRRAGRSRRVDPAGRQRAAGQQPAASPSAAAGSARRCCPSACRRAPRGGRRTGRPARSPAGSRRCSSPARSRCPCPCASTRWRSRSPRP